MYIDASAFVKLIVAEAESDPLVAFVRNHDLYSCSILVVEVHRAMRRRGIDASLARPFLDSVNLVEISQAQLNIAAAFEEQHLGALDAIHLASALMLAVDEIVTYDKQLAKVATRAGLLAVSPA